MSNLNSRQCRRNKSGFKGVGNHSYFPACDGPSKMNMTKENINTPEYSHVKEEVNKCIALKTLIHKIKKFGYVKKHIGSKPLYKLIRTVRNY